MHPGPGTTPYKKGAELPGLLDPHAGFDAKGPRLVRASDDGGAHQTISDTHWLATQLREVPPLNGREEAILVGEGDAAGPLAFK